MAYPYNDEASGALDGDGRAVDDVDDGVQLLLVQFAFTKTRMQSHLEVLDGAAQFRRFGAAGALLDLQALEHDIQHFLVLVQKIYAFRSDAIQLLAAVFGFHGRIAQLFQQGQRRVNHARARAVIAADQLLDRFDDFIAMARLVLQQMQNHQAQAALLEHARTASAFPAATTLFKQAAAVMRSFVTMVCGAMVATDETSKHDCPFLVKTLAKIYLRNY